MSSPHLIALLVLLLAGCSGESVPWHGRNIQHVMPDLAFTLTDHAGHQVTAGDYRGKVVLLYFGYAHCDDVCPTTLATLTRAVRSLGEQADQVRILFVSVDPQPDTPEVLHHHAMHFSPYVAGLTGNEKQFAEFAKRYRLLQLRRSNPQAHENKRITRCGHYAPPGTCGSVHNFSFKDSTFQGQLQVKT